MYNSQAAWAAYNMLIPYQERARMSWDPKQLASYLQSDKYVRIFNEDDGQYDYGQKFLYLLNDMQGALHDVNVEIAGDGSITYRVKDFEDLAEQMGYTSAMVDALVVSMNARNNSITNDDAQNAKLIDSYKQLTKGIINARDAAVAFAKGALEDNPELLNEDLQRVMDYLHDIGVIKADPKQFDQIIDDARKAIREAKEASEQEAASQEPTKLKTEADEASAMDSTASLLNNIQSFLDRNPRRLLVQPVMGSFEYSSDVVSYDTNRGKANQSSSSSSNSNSSSFSGHYSKQSSAVGKRQGQSGGDTLVNELGPELITDNGKAFIANGGKPGFVRLSDNAIVFTANETKDILKGKRNVNARAYATGNVGRGSLIGRLVRGSVNARGYISCPVCGWANPDSRSTCSHCGASLRGGGVATVNNSVGTSGNANAGVNRSAYGSPTAYGMNMGGDGYYYNPSTNTYTVTTYSDDGVWELQQRYDRLAAEMEIRRNAEKAEIALIEKLRRESKLNESNSTKNNTNQSLGSQLSGLGGGNYVGGADYASMADPQKVDWVAVRINRLQRTIADLEKVASSGFKKLDTRLRAARDQIAKTTDEIEVMERAYDRYIQEANSVGLSESIAANVREGTIDINSYDDDTRKKIDEYQEW